MTSVLSEPNGKVRVSTGAGCEEYDEVILATHSDTSLKILGDGATDEEMKILGALPYQSSTIYLHTGSDPNHNKSIMMCALLITTTQQLILFVCLGQVCLAQ